jgi:hypothetical protein
MSTLMIGPIESGVPIPDPNATDLVFLIEDKLQELLPGQSVMVTIAESLPGEAAQAVSLAIQQICAAKAFKYRTLNNETVRVWRHW